MKLISIQVGKPRDVVWQGKTIQTGIFKSQVNGPVFVRLENIDGDGQADLSVHGGRDKAVYAYGLDAYPWWYQKLNIDSLPPGAFGENLTLDFLDEKTIFLGNIYRLGACELQVAQPRFPCFKLGIKFNDLKIVKTFNESGRPGVYFRVLKEGSIQAGDTLELITLDPARVSIWDLFNLKLNGYRDRGLMSRMLNVSSLVPEWREKFSELLK